MAAETRINIAAIRESSEFRNKEKTPDSAMGYNTEINTDKMRQEDVEVTATKPCHQCYINRRTCEDKNIEREIFIRQDMEAKPQTISYQTVNERRGTGTDHTEANTTHSTNSSYTVGLDVESLGFRPQRAAKSNNVHFIERQPSVNTKHSSASSVESYKKASRCFSCGGLSCILSVFAAVVSLLGFAYVVYINNFQVLPKEVSPVITLEERPATAALQSLHDPQSTISARFMMGYPFKENGSFVWEPVESTNNGITVSQGCLIVPENGTYAVFSLITFRVFKENDVQNLVHHIRLNNAMENEQTFQRRIISVPAKENRGKPEVIPSLFVTFVGMKAGGGICVTVSESQYVYNSQLDNSINIFKLW